MGNFKRIVFSVFVLSTFLPFYVHSESPERVGLKQILNMDQVNFESGNYRLDPDFRLGYGDTVTINIWGKLQGSYKLTINRDGNIVIPLVGRVSVIGLTIDEAREAVRKEINKKYTNFEFDLNLTDIRDIKVTVLGNAQKPGPYAVSPFSRLVEVISKFDGPNENGTLTDIQLIRDGKVVTSFNTYDFIFKGDQSKNVRLKHGDMIYVPPVKNLVEVTGDVRYPGIYEVEDNSNLSQLIDLGGGMRPTDLKRKIYIMRINPATKIKDIFAEITFDQAKGIKKDNDVIIKNDDKIIVTTEGDYTPSKKKVFLQVEVKGEVDKPGIYLVREGETLSTLINRAGGFKNTAFLEGIKFTRKSVKEKQKEILEERIRKLEKSILEEEARLAEAVLTDEERIMRNKAIERRKEALRKLNRQPLDGRVCINIKEIIAGQNDMILEDGDTVFIPPIPQEVIVSGEVYNPQAVRFEEGKLIDYYIEMAGGVTRNADSESIYIITPSGKVKNASRGKIGRGDIIVVPEKEISLELTKSK